MTPQFPKNHVLLVDFPDPDIKYVQYVKKHANGTFSTILNTDKPMSPRGLPKKKLDAVFDRPATTRFVPTHQTPWRPHTYRQERIIPKDIVWKFTYEVSHAPSYYIEHDNGLFSGMFARVENVPGNNDVPYGEDKEQLLEWKNQHHVTVSEHPRNETPWQDNYISTTTK